MEIEDRIYGPDSSPAEIQMLCDRVQLYKEDILLFKELKIMSPFAIEVMTNEMARYLNNGQARKKYSFHRTREQAIKAIEDDKLKLKNT